MSHKKSLLIVVLASLLICVILGYAVWDIQFWPTDTKAYYYHAAIQLKDQPFISQMHAGLDQERVRWLHGKELFIYLASLTQRLLGDETTLRPFILVCLIAVGLSAILIFEISASFWGEQRGWLCYFLFISSFWPYLYVLFAKHQPLGLMFFLLSVFFYLHSVERLWGWILTIFSGASLGAALFSSSVSPLYIPYFLGVLAWQYFRDMKEYGPARSLFYVGRDMLCVLAGGLIILVWVTFPDLWHNIKSFWEYVQVSVHYNHFYYNQPTLQQWIPDNIAATHGGWLWIIRYFFLAMPVVFPLFLLSMIYIILDALRAQKKSRFAGWAAGAMILLSLSSPLLAYLKGVAQYGANYFTSLVGILILIGYAGYRFSLKRSQAGQGFWANPVLLRWLFSITAVMQVSLNGHIFFNDIYPTRMATTFISREIKKRGIKELYTYPKHPSHLYLVGQLDPWVKTHVLFKAMETIFSPQSGIAYIPPVTKDSIYIAAHSDYEMFDADPFLNILIKENRLDDYAIASFKTLASSRIWAHEEEILSYRYLILGQKPYQQDLLSRVWLLDLKKYHQDITKNTPKAEDLFILKNNIYNIGTRGGLNKYKGFMAVLKESGSMAQFAARIYKVGRPSDGLRAYAYRLDDVQPVWIPYQPENASREVAAADMTSNPEGGLVVFDFDPPIEQKQGPYLIKIYRSGPADDNNYYRLYYKFENRINIK